MKAVIIEQTGGPEVLQYTDISEPEICHSTDVKIRLHAAGVNPIDTKVRQHGLFYDNPFPAVLGCDGAGEVVAVGDQVTDFQAGDGVWFCHGGLGKEQGNYAQYTVVDQRWLSKKPKFMRYHIAAALPLVLITAYGALVTKGGLKRGQSVLIHAGAGGVGHVAIQLAASIGAEIFTTVSDQQKAEFVTSLGADHVLLYQQEDVAKKVNQITNGVGVDLVVDTVGPEVFKNSIEATAHFGTIVSLLDPGEFNFAEARMRNLKIAFELMLTPMLRGLDARRDKHVEILNDCALMLEQGRLRTYISEQFKLEQASQAHALVEQGHNIGKVVLTV